MKNHHQTVFSSHSDDISPGRDMSPDRGENIVITKIATVAKMLIMMMMMNRMVKKQELAELTMTTATMMMMTKMPWVPFLINLVLSSSRHLSVRPPTHHPTQKDQDVVVKSYQVLGG